VDNLWEIEPSRNSLRGNLCELYKDYEKSSLRNFEQEKEKDLYRKYRIRHFRTGRVLSFIEKFDGIDNSS